MADDVQVRLSSNAGDIADLIAQYPEEVVPDAVGLGFLGFGKRLVAASREHIEDRFEIRSPWVVKSWTAVAGTTIDGKPVVKGDGSALRGVVKDFARMWPHPVMTIGHRDPFMLLQEKGGIKRSTYRESGEGFVAIPTRFAVSMMDSRGRVPKTLRHYDLLRKDAAAIAETPVVGRAVQLRDPKGRDRHLQRRAKQGGTDPAIAIARAAGVRMTQLVRPFARIVPRTGLFALADARSRQYLLDDMRWGFESATNYWLQRARTSRVTLSALRLGRAFA